MKKEVSSFLWWNSCYFLCGKLKKTEPSPVLAAPVSGGGRGMEIQLQLQSVLHYTVHASVLVYVYIYENKVPGYFFNL